MTKDEWLLVKNKLSHPWGLAELMVDGYKLSLRVERAKALKFVIAPYVSGEFKGAWLRGDCEEAKRFLRPVQVAAYTPAAKVRITKGCQKRPSSACLVTAWTRHSPAFGGDGRPSGRCSANLKSRVSITFGQATWDGVTWADSLKGNPTTAKYNDILSPVEVTNLGAVTERWLLRFTSASAFEIIGEHVGVIGAGNINTETAPLNPATDAPYFTLQPVGWGLGWAVGNILRFNTVGAMFPVWVVRTIQQGAESVQDDSFTLLVRGDVDRP